MAFLLRTEHVSSAFSQADNIFIVKFKHKHWQGAFIYISKHNVHERKAETW